MSAGATPTQPSHTKGLVIVGALCFAIVVAVCIGVTQHNWYVLAGAAAAWVALQRPARRALDTYLSIRTVELAPEQ